MSSTTSLDNTNAQRGGSAAPHVIWDTPGVSVQGWSGSTAYALDVLVPSSLEHRFVGSDAVLARLDDVLKANPTPDDVSRESFATKVAGASTGRRVYELHPAKGGPVVLLACADVQEFEHHVIRLRVVLWSQSADTRFTGTSPGRLAFTYARLTMDQLGPKALMEDIALAFGVTASVVDGLSTASIVATSKGQALSTVLRSRFLWWFTASAMLLSLMFVPLVVMGGDLSLSGAANLAVVLAVGAWGLVTTRRNWRRRGGR